MCCGGRGEVCVVVGEGRCALWWERGYGGSGESVVVREGSVCYGGRGVMVEEGRCVVGVGRVCCGNHHTLWWIVIL